MVPLLELWLPILLSGIVVFAGSALAWMALPHHKSEWAKLSNERSFMKSVAELKIAPGQYIFPCAQSSAEMKGEEYKQRVQKGPVGTLTVWDSPPNMTVNMLRTFLHFLFVSFFIAYLGTRALERGTEFMEVFRFVTMTGVMAYCLAGIPGAIWFKRKMAGDLVDGIAFAVLTGVVFAWLWPQK